VGDQGQPFNLGAPTISGVGTLLNGAGFTFQAIGTNGSPISTAALAAMGITLDPTTGKVSSASGPTSAVSFTIQVSDSLISVPATGCSVTIHATPALACGTSSPATGEVGLGYSSTMTVSGGTAPFTFTPSSASTLSAMGLAASPVSPTNYTTVTVATPASQTVQQAGTITFQVTDGAGVTASQTCPVTTVAKPVLTCGAVNAQGTVNQQFSSPALTGSVSLGSGNLLFSAVDANGNAIAQPLLGGLTLNTSTGAIGGVPTAAGGFFIKVADGNGVAAANTCPVQIVAPAVLTVSKTSGSFTMGGQASFTITVGNSATSGGTSATGVVLTDNLPNTNGLTWSTAAASNNAPCTISNGYQLSCALDTIAPGGAVSVTVMTPSSTPALACTQQVNVAAVVTAANAASPNPATGTLTCAPPPLALSCPTGTATVGASYTSQASGSGGVPPYSFSVVSGSLPAGLTLNTTTGQITGTPTAGGTYSFQIQITDARGSTATSSGCGITVAWPPVTANCVTIQAVQGSPITPVTMTATGGNGTYTFSATGLPAGLSMASTGTISGTPTVSGTFSYTVTIKDGAGNIGTVNCSVTVNPAPTASCVTINAVQGVAITPVTMTGTGGAGGTYTLSATGLPSGLSMAANGTISGTPTVSGTFSYTVTIKDGAGNIGTVNCSVTVNPPPTASCVTINAIQGVAITPVTMTGTGGAGGTYTFSATGSPSGLSMASNGTISGTPTVSGTFSYTVTIKDGAGNIGTVNCSVTVNPPPTASCVTINAIQGVAITPVTMTGTGGAGGTYTFSATGLPSGLTMASNGTISGTPTVSGTFSYTVAVRDGAGNTGTVNCSVTVNPPPTANCVTITAVQGVAITPVTMTGSGGAGGTYTFSATGLPSGLTMAGNGTISGTPTVSGTFSYTVAVRDGAGNTGTVNCSVTVNPPVNPLTISCPAGTGTVGVPYASSAPVTGAVGTLTFSVASGTLPPGMTLNASSGAVTGTPTVGGTYSFTLQVQDSGTGNRATSSACGITISTTPAQICGGDTATIGFWHNQNGQALINAVNGGGSSTALSSWLVQQFPTLFGSTSTYNLTGDTNAQVASVYMTAFANDKTFAQIFAGALAAYVTNSGLAGGSYAGPYGFNYSAGGTAGKTWNVGTSGSGIGLSNNTSYTLMQILVAANQTQSTSPDSNAANVIFNGINQGGDIGTGGCGGMTPLTMNCAAGSAVVGVPYSSAVTAAGGVGAYTFTLLSGSLPPGLTLSSNGTISGTPTGTGTYTYVVQVTDSQGNTAQTAGCSITVNPAVTATCASITAVQGAAITPVTMTASGGTGSGYTFTATGLPAGLSMASNGTISGTPTVSGTFSYTVTVKDSAGNTGTVNCSVTVAAPVSANCASITAVKGTAITAVTMTGTGGMGAPYTFTATGLPAGLTMASNGTISGTPTVSGTFSYTVTVTDKSGNTGTVSCSVTVAAPPVPLTLSCPSSATGTVGSAYSSSVAASGGTGPYSYSLASGALPPGLALNSSTGAITGSPTTGGNFAFSIRVTDSKGATALSSCATSCGGTVSWNFVNPVGNVGTSQPYTFNNLTVTAYGYTGTSTGTAASLYANDTGGDLYGLGISGSANNQIDTGHFVTLDISAINAAGGANAQITIAGASSTDTFTVYGSNTLGSIATTSAAVLASGGAGNDLVPLSIPGFSGYKYISVRANTGAVLVEAISFSLGNCNITIGGTSIVSGDAATIGFWHNKNGQALINAMPSSPALGNWLANNFPYLYGPSSSNNLTNASNATVASLFMTLFGNDKTGAQIMAGALASYVTSTSLSGTGAISCGFNSSVQGTGGKLYNVGSSGATIGLVNSTNYTVMQLLLQVNLAKANGTYSSQANAFNVIFSGINQTGDIQ
jgi:hypothetical protein